MNRTEIICVTSIVVISAILTVLPVRAQTIVTTVRRSDDKTLTVTTRRTMNDPLPSIAIDEPLRPNACDATRPAFEIINPRRNEPRCVALRD